jgi:hypothetical protein
MKLTHLVLSMTVAAALGGAQTALAHGEAASSPAKPTIDAANAASADEALHIVRDNLAVIEKELSEKNLKGLHDLTDVSLAAARALQKKAMPPAEKKVRFDAAAKQLAAQLEKLHVTADAGDQLASEAEFKKTRGALKLVDASIK